MSDTEDAKLVEELRALNDETMCFDGPGTYALIHRAAATIERLHEIAKSERARLEGEIDSETAFRQEIAAKLMDATNKLMRMERRCQDMESALSTARTAAFREAAEVVLALEPPASPSLADIRRGNSSDVGLSAYLTQRAFNETREKLYAVLDAKAKEGTHG